MVNLDKIITDYKLVWQYPVITEKAVCEQEKNNPNYIGFPMFLPIVMI